MPNCNSTLPNIIVIGLYGKVGENLIDGVIGNQVIESEIPDNYTWFIDNKYYTSTVNFYNVKDYRDLSSAALNCVEAILIYIDPSQKSVLEEVELILHSFTGKCELDKQILVVDKFEDGKDQNFEGITKLESLKWCITHGFELVELSSEENDDDYGGNENEENILDRSLLGIYNIKQSLHAHCWTNLKLKDKADRSNFALLQAENVIPDANADDNLLCSEVKILNHFEEAEVDSFSSLLSTLGDMKIKANFLPNDERKIFAEKITINFWQSLGGDDEEVIFLNSDSE